MRRGTLAGIYQENKQVGGLINWRMEAERSLSITRRFEGERNPWTVEADRFWLLDYIKNGVYLFKFFLDITGTKRCFYGEAKLVINEEDPVNEMIEKKIKLSGETISYSIERIKR